jgi:hypothetical protein
MNGKLQKIIKCCLKGSNYKSNPSILILTRNISKNGSPLLSSSSSSNDGSPNPPGGPSKKIETIKTRKRPGSFYTYRTNYKKNNQNNKTLDNTTTNNTTTTTTDNSNNNNNNNNNNSSFYDVDNKNVSLNLNKVLIFKKITRYEYEKKRFNNINDRSLKELVN